MKIAHISLVLCLALVLTACGKRPPAAGGGAGGLSSSTGFGAPAELMFPDPGPFKVVEGQDRDGDTVEFLQARGEPGAFGGNFRVSTFGSGPKTFNPWAAADVESSGIGLLMFERLVEIDAWTGKPYPRLAKTIEVSPDNLEYTMTLRKGLKWSDGKPLTADDVVFTFGTLVKGGFGNSSNRDVLSVYGKYPTVKKVDDYTVRFRTAYPFAPFLNSIRSIPVAPKHVVEPQTRKPVEEFHTFWDVNADPAKMVVSGPFKLARYVPGQRVELERNSNYGMVDKKGRQLPYLDRFSIHVVPDQNTMLLKFMGNEIEFLDVRSVRGSDVAKMKERETASNYRMYNLGPNDGTLFLMFNMNRRQDPKTGKPYVDPVKQEWFNNMYFRQAVNHAINRKLMVNNILRGVGLPLFTYQTPASLYFNASLKPYQQDLDLSRELLSKGGFTFKEGRLYDSKNHPVEFTLQTNAGNAIREAACVMIANDLKKLGIKVNFQALDFNVLVSKTENSLDWEAIVMGLSGSRLEPYDGANVWKSNGRLHMFDQRLPDTRGNVIVFDARDWEKRIDELYDKGATTFGVDERRKFFDESQAIVYEQQPFIYLFASLDITAMRNTVGNYKPTLYGINYTPMGSLHNIEEIYFKPSTQTNTASGRR